MTHWFRNTSNGHYFGIVRAGDDHRIVFSGSSVKPDRTPAVAAMSRDVRDVTKDEALRIVRENYQTGWEE